MAPPLLLAVPNVSEGRDSAQVAALESAFAHGVSLLDRHADTDHNRAVFTIAGDPNALIEALLCGARRAIESIDMKAHTGVHPAIGALDVCPFVWLDPAGRDAAIAAAKAMAGQIGELGVPALLYGALASSPDRVERAYFRNGGLAELALRMESGELLPDAGPAMPHSSAGATLITARPPLAAFNVELGGGDLDLARSVAASLREAGGGLSGVRAIGLPLASGRAQISTNVHDPLGTPLAAVVERVRELAKPLGERPVEAEIVGLVPEKALAGFPGDVPIRDFDPELQTIERRLAASSD